ncbi:hypothetical protein CPJ18_13175 [Agrobacterium rosae]|uniref:Uncharacterized protein n=1 Tax=Agrobacterium rosae TaxID=1972867 RepID=A0AAE5RXN7_9HYPH|nr:hypothetical protein CPJ18_13175 [Agrobacterium rosae]
MQKTLLRRRPTPLPSSLCLSQGSSRRASARRKDSLQPKDLGWLDSCDEHRNEGETAGLQSPLTAEKYPPPNSSPFGA